MAKKAFKGETIQERIVHLNYVYAGSTGKTFKEW